MTSGTDRMPRLVVGVDGSEASLAALDQAAQEAVSRGAQLQIVGAWRFPTSAGVALVTTIGLEGDAKVTVREAASRSRAAHPELSVHESVSSSPAMIALVDASAGADLLVVGSEGRGAFSRILIGSVSQYAVIHAHCPVMVVRSPATPQPPNVTRPIVVGLDGSEPAAAALDWAIDEAERQAVPLRVICAWTDPRVFATRSDVRQAAESVLDESLGHVQTAAPGLVAEGSTIEGHAAAELITASYDARMLVVGSRGLGGFLGLLLGSVGQHCVAHASCSVVVVRPIAHR